MPQPGSANSSATTSSPPATLTVAPSSTSRRTTSKAIPNATSSPESGSGPTPFAVLDGGMTNPSGLGLLPVKDSAPQGRAKASRTSVTSGPCSSISSVSAALQFSLVSKLKRRSASAGSTLFKLTWKESTTPSGRPVSLLRASALRTSGQGSTSSEKQIEPSTDSPNQSSWVTPSARDWKDTAGMATTATNPDGTERSRVDQLPRQVQLSSWPTPTVGNAAGSQMAKDASPTGRRPDGSKATVSLNAVAQVAGWPTPTTRDHKDGSCEGTVPVNALLGRAVWAAGWPSPGASDGNGGKGPRKGVSMTGQMPDGSKVTMGLSAVAKLALSGWPTPHANSTTGAGSEGRDGGLNIQTAAQTAGWATPQARDHFPAHSEEYIAAKKAQGHGMQNLNDQVQMVKDGPARLTASGQLLTGSSAGMASGGQLCPALSRWLMGLPPEWCLAALTASDSITAQKMATRSSRRSKSKAEPESCASKDTATPSAPKSRKGSSKATSKPGPNETAS